jgi:hypothetical protein
MSQLLATAGSWIDRIKINALTREVRDGRTLWVKRRTASARAIIHAANSFFWLAGNPVMVLGEIEEWRRWEIACFQRLHGDAFHAFAEGAHTICAEEIPGQNLSRHLDAGTLTPVMLAAAARELRRAHACECETFDGLWSHGDPHLGNFLYDAPHDRARLIDFEVRHRHGIDARERHADDLLVFLQDLVGRVSRADWLPWAQTFLAAYGDAEIVSRVIARLVRPRGIASLWWAVRTTYLTPRELAERLESLRANVRSNVRAIA